MRYNRTIYFVRNGEKEYDPATGNYHKHPPDKTAVPASVMNTKTATLQIVYGDVRQKSLTVQVQNHYDKPFDRIEIDGRLYRVDYSRRLGTKHVFTVSEAQ